MEDKEKQKINNISSRLLTEYEKIKSSIIVKPNENVEYDITLNKDKQNLLIIIDDLEFISKVKKDPNSEKLKNEQEEIVNLFKELSSEKEKEKDINIIPLTISQIWENCYDSKYDIIDLIIDGEIIKDNGLIASIKLVGLHKRKVITKFKRYVVSYVLAGSLVRGEANKKSDVDAFVVVDDTDVKRMPRNELKEKLRAIIVGMGMETARELQVENKLNVQVYILTDFWESLKEANPVIYTLLRDGIPFYDKGTFMPWKQLLSLGMIQPSFEAIDKMFNSGEKILESVNHRIKNLAIEDLFYAMMTPSQSTLMLYGLAPPAPKEAIRLMKKVFVVEEKILEEKYIDMLNEIVEIRKNVEHDYEKAKITGKDLDKLMRNAQLYLKRIKKLVQEIQIKKDKELITNIYDDTLNLSRKALKEKGIKRVKDDEIVKELKEQLIETGELKNIVSVNVNKIILAHEKYIDGNLSKSELERSRREFRVVRNEIESMLDKDKISLLNKNLSFEYSESKKVKSGKAYLVKKGILVYIEEKNKQYYELYDKKAKNWGNLDFKENELENYLEKNLIRGSIDFKDLEILKTRYKSLKIII